MWIYLLIKVNIQHNEDFMNIIFLAHKAFEYLLIFWYLNKYKAIERWS